MKKSNTDEIKDAIIEGRVADEIGALYAMADDFTLTHIQTAQAGILCKAPATVGTFDTWYTTDKKIDLCPTCAAAYKALHDPIARRLTREYWLQPAGAGAQVPAQARPTVKREPPKVVQKSLF